MEVSGQFYAPATLLPREGAPGTHWIGGWVDPRAGLDAVAKRKIPSPCRGSNPDRPIHSLITTTTTTTTIIIIIIIIIK
jgi:hypothetical protein